MAASAEKNSVEYVIEQAISQGEETLRQTVDMNPVLKKAGVVDAGGKGFLVILKGMLAALRGETMPTLETEHAARDKADFASVGDEDITFAFDTVFIVRRIDDRSIEPFREFLNGIGDSLVIGEDDEAFKVHVHTDTPGVALTEAQRYGTLELAKIENMRTQAEDLAAGRKAQSTDDLEEDGHDHAAPAPQPQELKPFGFLAVCAGDGLAAVFADLGADGIVNGGQTMNPSTESILTEVERIAAETVFVLPNNKNIVMAAQQCAGLSEKKVIVIPTATVPQGISAMMAVDPDETDAAAIEQAMNAAASAVTTAQITYAARNSEFDGFAIREGDYLALLEGKLFDTDTSIGAVLEKLAAEADSRGAGVRQPLLRLRRERGGRTESRRAVRTALPGRGDQCGQRRSAGVLLYHFDGISTKRNRRERPRPFLLFATSRPKAGTAWRSRGGIRPAKTPAGAAVSRGRAFPARRGDS